MLTLHAGSVLGDIEYPPEYRAEERAQQGGDCVRSSPFSIRRRGSGAPMEDSGGVLVRSTYVG